MSDTNDLLTLNIFNEDVNVPVPGGTKEAPSSKPYDETKLSVPGKTELTTNQWNAALGALKKSFKEQAEIIEILENAVVVNESVEEQLERVNNEVIDNALFEAYDSGAFFEKVDRTDKDDVKAIVNKVRPKAQQYFDKEGIKFYKPKGGRGWWTRRLWQIVGVFITEEARVPDIMKKLNESMKADTGDFKLLHVKAAPSFVDLFRMRWNYKREWACFWILVDKKLPSEKELNAEQKADLEAAPNKGGKAAPVKESVEDFTESEEFFEAKKTFSLKKAYKKAVEENGEDSKEAKAAKKALDEQEAKKKEAKPVKESVEEFTESEEFLEAKKSFNLKKAYKKAVEENGEDSKEAKEAKKALDEQEAKKK